MVCWLLGKNLHAYVGLRNKRNFPKDETRATCEPFCHPLGRVKKKSLNINTNTEAVEWIYGAKAAGNGYKCRQ